MNAQKLKLNSTRVVALIDMDCFYVQVEQREFQKNHGVIPTPAAVVQYNPYKGGGIIAVDYAARAKGVNRHMRGDEAASVCPEIHLLQVPCVSGKADLTKYRDAGAEVIESISQYAECVERASIDEAYVDLTKEVENQEADYQSWDVSKFMEALEKSTHLAGLSKTGDDRPLKEEEKVEELSTFVSRLVHLRKQHASLSDECGTSNLEIRQNIDNNKKVDETSNECWWSEWCLLIGSCIVQKMRATVELQTGFQCSAGIAHNKILAKLACGLHKPNKQTLLTRRGVVGVYQNTPIKKVRGLGGKFGEELCRHLGVKMMAQLTIYSQVDLQKQFGDSAGAWLYALSRGRDEEPVKSRKLALSIGCSKRFPGKGALDTEAKVLEWLRTMCDEISGRLRQDIVQNQRKAKLLTVYIRYGDADNKSSQSRCTPLKSYDSSCIQSAAFSLLKEYNQSNEKGKWCPLIYSLGLGASKFVSHSSDMDSSSSANIVQLFQKVKEKNNSISFAQPSTSSYTFPVIASPSVSPAKKKRSLTTMEKFLQNASAENAQTGTIPTSTLSSSALSEIVIDSKDDPLEQCAECLAMIPLQNFPEHCDYHVAERLQREWNGTSQMAAQSTLKAANITGQMKRKQPLPHKISGVGKRVSEGSSSQKGTLLQYFNKL